MEFDMLRFNGKTSNDKKRSLGISPDIESDSLFIDEKPRISLYQIKAACPLPEKRHRQIPGIEDGQVARPGRAHL